jgi:hypothetical protein
VLLVTTDTLSNTASTATPARRLRSASGTPSFSKVLSSSGSTWSIPTGAGFLGAE